MYVKYPSGELAKHFFDGKITDLNYQIHAKSGIPLAAQKLYYQSCPLKEGNISSIPNGCSLELSLSLCGGAGHCDIRYEDGEFTRSDCQGKVYCTDCCKSAHKHPSHSSHNPVPITSKCSNLEDSPSNKSYYPPPLLSP